MFSTVLVIFTHLFRLHSSLSTQNLVQVTLPTWHRCLGQPVSSIINFYILVIFFLARQINYEFFMLVKLEKYFRLPFSLSSTKISCVFKLIHFDLWTSHVTSTSGFKYYILFLNEFSHFLWVFTLHAKSKVYTVFFFNFHIYVKKPIQN